MPKNALPHDPIGAALRTAYVEAVNEPVPARLLNVLAGLPKGESRGMAQRHR